MVILHRQKAYEAVLLSTGQLLKPAYFTTHQR
jgi:hypothetical protein